MHRIRSSVLIALPIVVTIAAATLSDPLPQDPAYHEFADTRTLYSIRNFWNVISNLPFLFVGAAGIFLLWKHPEGERRDLLSCYTVFFAGVLLTAAGSAWYHWQPDTRSLVWDRLPMTLAFMGLMAAVVGEYVSPTAARRLLPLLLLAGLMSVAWWAWSEAHGAGDLRPYVLVQFLPLLMIPLIVLLYPGDRAIAFALWGMLLLYLIAKVCEEMDAVIFDYGELLSGHTIKHLLAAAAAWLLLRALRHRANAGNAAERR